MKIVLNKKRLLFFMLLLVCLLFTIYGMSNGTNKLGLIALALGLFYMLVGSDEDNFDFLVAMIPLQSCWLINGQSLRGLMCLVPAFITTIKRRFKFSGKIKALFYGVFLISLEVINDLTHESFPSFINMVSPIVYLTVFGLAFTDESYAWDIQKMMKIFVLSSTIVCLGNLIYGGGLSAYYNEISWYRFGQESALTLLPGAMEIPMFSCISIFSIFCFFIYGVFDTWPKKLFWGLILGLQLMFGMLTVSRVFILGLFMMTIVVFIWIFASGKGGRLAKFFPIILLVFAILYFSERELIHSLIKKLFNRLSINSDTADNGRTFIWSSCINYLFSNIKALLIGEGIEYYSVLGAEKGYAFSYMAHNFYLDVLMGVGILGAISLYSLFHSIVIPQRHRNILSYGILVILAGMFLVSGTLNYIRNYIYIIMAIIFLNNFKNQIEKSRSNQVNLDNQMVSEEL